MTEPRFRPATPGDLPALTGLWRDIDTHWFGSPEHDETEVREELDLLDDLARDTRLCFVGDRLVGAAAHGRHESTVLVRPGVAPALVHDDMLAWVSERLPTRVEALDRDSDLLSALGARRWRHSHSSFELSRSVSDDWPAADPVWPDGVELRDVDPAGLGDVHRLVYVEAGFADVPGHVLRDLDEWRRLFVGDRSLRDHVIVATIGDRLVGVSLVRIFSDGLGWISQLAVARSERGRGLGRALVLESLHRLIASGATALGLGVMAANRGALGLYLSLGLSIDREWQLWDAPERL